MLKLTQIIKGYKNRTVYVAARHVVAVYPDVTGNGCHIELSTNAETEGSILHVSEDVDLVGSHPFLNSI